MMKRLMCATRAIRFRLDNRFLLARFGCHSRYHTSSINHLSQYSAPPIEIMPHPYRHSLPLQPHIRLEDDYEGAPISNLERRLDAIRRSGEVPAIAVHDARDDEVLAAFEREIAQVIDLDEDLAPPQDRARSASGNLAIDPQSLLSEYRQRHLYINQGAVVEVPRRPAEELSWEFLEVRQIYKKGPDVILRGIRLTRQRYLEGMLPRNRNEVCALLEVQKDDNREWADQAAVDVPVAEVIRTRHLRKTNALYPKFRFNGAIYTSIEAIERRAPIVQRWVFVKIYRNSQNKQQRRSLSGIIRRLREDEIEDPILRVSDSSLRNAWRAGVMRGGSYVAGGQAIPVAELNEVSQVEPIIRAIGQRYCAGDFFCGAGGASCGMKKAGFEVVVACDMDQAACETYRANFPTTNLFQMEVHDFVKAQIEARSKRHTDVLHLSPPCQTWSPAHTHPGPNDEANAAALFSCGDILATERPRITTGEQTFGILFGRFKSFFHSLVNQYTSLGYSFEWDVLDLSNYGLAQPRKRAIWIAACPGEALPPFPAPTHGDQPGLRQTVTVHQALQGVGTHASLHDPLHNVDEMFLTAQRYGSYPKTPWDSRAPLRRSITTGCADNYHPSGLRNFTIRENAILQGFPSNYRFRGRKTDIKRQIGNAFAPTVVEVLYSHIHRWLLRQDNVIEQIEIDREDSDNDMMIMGELRKEIIVIDNDDDDTQSAVQSNAYREVVMINDDDDRLMSFEPNREDSDVEYDDDDTIRLSRESSRTLSVGSQEDISKLD
ncbi:S-adenosyl-L-methionine-dependent methyltransferase [Biscogniauxia marginata]|nr:S-adenosyl-L-methionine-dependent methyltransferase [Biscogniauxia marginata]